MSGRKVFNWRGYVGDSSFFFDDGDYINEKSVKDVIDYLKEDSENTAYITISSGGGSAFTAAAMIGMLESYRSRIQIEAIGLVASAASIIAIAASDKLYARSSSIVMIHEAIIWTVGGIAEHESNINLLRIVNDNAARIYSDRSNLSLQEAKDAMAAETWYSAERALEAGLVQGILEPNEEVTEDKVEETKNEMRQAYQKLVQAQKKAVPTATNNTFMRVPSNSSQEGRALSTGGANMPEDEGQTDPKNNGGNDGGGENQSTTTNTDSTPTNTDPPANTPANEAALQQANRQLRVANDILREENTSLRQQLAEVSSSTEEQRNEETLLEALRTGRISPVEREKWEGRLKQGGKLAREMLMERPVSEFFMENGVAYDENHIDSVPVDLRKKLEAQGYKPDEILAAWKAEKDRV